MIVFSKTEDPKTKKCLQLYYPTSSEIKLDIEGLKSKQCQISH
jgi:hypothetical protein